MHENLFEAKVILITTTSLIVLLVFVIVAALLIQQKRRFIYKQKMQDLLNENEKALLLTELKVKEDIYKTVSQSLHDNIGSNISTAMLFLYRDEWMDENELDANRKDALQMLGRIIDDLKNIARSMNPDYFQGLGLDEAIKQRISQIEKTKRFNIKTNIQRCEAKLDPKTQLVLYYIFQEAINNIMTHSKATSIEVALIYEKDTLCLRIFDDGRGIPEDIYKGRVRVNGSGLLTIKHHAALINAKLDIESEFGRGTVISVMVGSLLHE